VIFQYFYLFLPYAAIASLPSRGGLAPAVIYVPYLFFSQDKSICLMFFFNKKLLV